MVWQFLSIDFGYTVQKLKNHIQLFSFYYTAILPYLFGLSGQVLFDWSSVMWGGADIIRSSSRYNLINSHPHPGCSILETIWERVKTDWNQIGHKTSCGFLILWSSWPWSWPTCSSSLFPKTFLTSKFRVYLHMAKLCIPLLERGDDLLKETIVWGGIWRV